MDFLEKETDKRCPLCNVDATLEDLRVVTVEDGSETNKYI